MFVRLIPPCSCVLLTLRWFICVFPGSCVQTRRFLFCCLSFDSLWFYGLLCILCFCIWTMGFHYTVARFWFLSACFHVCVWVAFCVTLRISSSSPPSMGSRSGRSWLFFGGFTLGIKANNVFYLFWTATLDVRAKSRPSLRKVSEVVVWKIINKSFGSTLFSPWQVLGKSVACQRLNKN